MKAEVKEKGILVIGAGGHAKVCIEIFQANGNKVDFCIANEGSPALCLGIPVLTGQEQLLKLFNQGYQRVFIAIGMNALRSKLAKEAVDIGFELINSISPFAYVSPSVKLGVGVAIMAGAIIHADSIIGDLAIINTAATIDHDCVINKAAHIAPQCALAGNVTVGDASLVGIGTNVIPNIIIGSHTTIGAGSVVISNISSHAKAVGHPAKIVLPKTEFHL